MKKNKGNKIPWKKQKKENEMILIRKNEQMNVRRERFHHAFIVYVLMNFLHQIIFY